MRIALAAYWSVATFSTIQLINNNRRGQAVPSDSFC